MSDDRYDVWGRIGCGGMSDVWLARHVGLGVPVVLKTLRAEVEARGHDPRARMLAEARLMARVTSPHVVRAIDTGELFGVPFVAQEYVDGIDLAELDRRRRDALGVGLPLWFVCEAIDQCCDALSAAHRVGVIHRDVKPSNLFATPDGIRLGDFGIAIDADSCRAADVSGTIKFMAPELFTGQAPSRAADVYSLGATAFDLRYGRAPFLEYSEVRDPHARPPFASPRTASESFFQHTLGLALEKNPDVRLPDPKSLQREIRTLRRVLGREAMSRRAVATGPTTFRLGRCEVSLVVGDIAQCEADAIVSSANYEMKMRSGVGDALRRAGGDEIETAAMAHGERELGTCVVTRAGRLRTHHILHAVSAWKGTSVVGRTTHRALLTAEELGARSLALCALGTGAANVTMETCANAMMSTLRFHLALGGSKLERVVVYLLDEDKLRAFRDVALDALGVLADAGADVGLACERAERPSGDAATHISDDSALRERLRGRVA
ncbi:MAG: serine/threonine-protein kinase [Myxococcales bacterium]|nr:serine/threonine-protein kinase [Myxococcales bacterium]